MDIKEVEIQAPWGKISLKLWGNEDNPAILTVHGIMDNAGSFDGIIPLLPQHYYYICVDLPGHGRSDHFPPHLPIHSIDYILVYTLVMNYFKRERYIIMGHSYGGQLGYLYAQLYPERVEKLIMFDTVHMFPVPSKYFTQFLEDKLNRHLHMEKKKQMKSAPQYTYEEALDKMMIVAHSSMTDESLKAQVTRFQARSSPLTEKSAKALLERMLVPKGNGKYELSLDQRLKYFINPLHDNRYIIETMKENSVQCPILLVFGMENGIQRKILRPVLDILKKQKNVIIKYVPGHHDVHSTDPERVAPHVVRFLSLQKSKL